MASDFTRFTSGLPISRRPDGMGKFHFVVLAALRAAQLKRGCTPLVDGDHKATVTAQHEIGEGKISGTIEPAPVVLAVVPIG